MPLATNGTARIGWTQHSEGASTVLLIMGAALGQRMWHRMIPALSDRYRVLTYDNRGIGDSIGSRGPFTMDDLARDGLAVLDAAGVDDAHVVGASLGGLTAQQFALVAPDRVRSLVLCCTGTPKEDDLPRNGGLARRVAMYAPRWLLAEVGIRGMCGPGVERSKVREDVAIVRSTAIRRSSLNHQGAAVGTFEGRDQLGTIRAPTLVLHGDRDRTVPIERGRELAGLIDGARFEVLPGSDHNFGTDNTERANHVVRTFIDEVEARSN